MDFNEEPSVFKNAVLEQDTVKIENCLLQS